MTLEHGHDLHPTLTHPVHDSIATLDQLTQVVALKLWDATPRHGQLASLLTERCECLRPPTCGVRCVAGHAQVVALSLARV